MIYIIQYMHVFCSLKDRPTVTDKCLCSMPRVWPYPKVPHRRSFSRIDNILVCPKYYPNPWSNKGGIDLERYSIGVKNNASFSYQLRKWEGYICTPLLSIGPVRHLICRQSNLVCSYLLGRGINYYIPLIALELG